MAPSGLACMMRTAFRHEAFLYADADEFLAGTVPFLRDGLEAEEPALVAVGRSRAKALRGELGRDGKLVRFIDMEALGRNPARIIPFWHEFVEDDGDGRNHPRRGIGEPVWPGRGPAEVDECQRHESLLNYAFWDGPAWRLLCPYDSAGLGDEVLAAAHESHACVSGSAADPDEAAGEDLDPLSCRPFAGVLPRRPADAAAIGFDRSGLHEARTFVGGAARRAGLSSDRTFDLVAAIGELTANSVMHGGGSGVLSLWVEADAMLVEVEDAGRIEAPLTGRLRPAPAQEGGRGVWMANQLCDLVQIRSGRQGTTVRLHMKLTDRA
ncbi:MAG TPA: sensor histidine kinase [Solirubrobacterales bacterium]